MENRSTFPGFEHYDATFVFCPNSYLDWCVNAFDRGVVRTVGFVLYETWSFMGFTPDGQCHMVGGEQPADSRDTPQLWNAHAETSAMVQEVCRYWRSVRPRS